MADPSLAHLLGRLAVLESRVRAAVAVRREGDPHPDDPFRGLHLSDEDVERILAGRPPAAAAAEPTAGTRRELERRARSAAKAGHTVRLLHLAETFALDPLDVDVLLVALAPDVDSRFEWLYGYLHDDVTRKRASVGLALELCGLAAVSGAGRDHLGAGGPLIDGGLVEIEEPERPVLTRPLRVPDRVTAHLLGSDRPDAALRGILVGPPALETAGVEALAAALGRSPGLCYLRERPGSAGRGLAAAALARMGRSAVTVDLARLGPHDDVVALARIAGREARLRGAGLVAGPVEALIERGAGAVRAFAELPGLVLLTGRGTWDPLWGKEVPLLVDVAAAGPAERAAVWRANLNGDVAGDPAEATAHFRLTPEQVERAARGARRQASLAGGVVTTGDLRAGARAQNAAGLERLARRIEPAVGWADLVLPPAARAALAELTTRARHRERVIGEWGMQPGGGRGRGVTALFAGDSGTGKTMSAEVIAGELGLDLYSIDLSTVVDKYVGETEKNLERIFSEADGVNAVLLFDEADAIFGKRSEVRDAHDRYANIEVAYLLQRMESFDGLAILSTNLRANLDEAFLRRLDAVVDFPMPDAGHRRALWERCLPPVLGRAGDVDLDFCAERFELSGGNIRSIAVTAAYRAAESGAPLSMGDVVAAVQREYRKLGRLCVEAEFGEWLGRVNATPGFPYASF